MNGVGGVAGDRRATTEVARRRRIAAAHRKGVRPFIRAEALDDHGVAPGLQDHLNPRLQPTSVIDIGDLGARGLKMIAQEEPEPGVEA